MKLKTLLQGSVFTAALAVCMATGIVTANAADGDFSTAGVNAVSIDTTKQELKATGSNGELLVGVGKVNAKKQITVAAWDVYDGTGAATIDLSKLSNVKDNYLVLSANGKDEVSVVKIPAGPKAVSAIFDPSTGVIKVGTGAKAADAKSAAAEITTDAYEYRTSYGTWTNLFEASKQIDLTKYQKQGATLYVRARGASGTSASSASSTLSTQGTEELTYIDSAKKEHKVKVYDGAALPSKEAKVNIAATAKGPNVAIDYTKGIVTLPKNSEYRGVDATAIKWDKDNANKPVAVGTAAVKANVSDIFTQLAVTADTMTLEVRTVATEGKKAATKWNRVKIAKPVALSNNLLTAGNTADTKPIPSAGETKEYGGKGIAEASVKEDATKDKVLAISYAVASKKDVIVIENKGALTYEVVTAAKDATAPAAEAKATKIAPTKKVTIKNVADESTVFIRVAGDKKTQTWVGEYAKLGIVDYPKSVSTPAAS